MTNTPIDQALHYAEAICQQKSVRLTTLRRHIFTLICQEKGFVKAYDLLEKLKGSSYSAKPPTVYRALDFLIEHRLIHKLNSINAYAPCTHPDAHHQCFFMICTECQTINECCNYDLEKNIQSMADASQFSVKRTTIEIEGICANCNRMAS